jgi:Alkaline phosphatase
MENGQKKLQDLLNHKMNTKNAKNVIMFLGDGMSFATVAAARMYLGGEEQELSFEKFPHYGFSKVIHLLFTLSNHGLELFHQVQHVHNQLNICNHQFKKILAILIRLK